MNKSVQLAIRASEIRSEINGLEPGDATLAKRRELLERHRVRLKHIRRF